MRALTFALLFLTSAALADSDPLPPAALEDEAELIIAGKVVASRVLTHRTPRYHRHYVRLSVSVETVKRGAQLIAPEKNSGDWPILDVRCWTERFRDDAAGQGHQTIPRDGSRVRLWLVRAESGYWEPLLPNGIRLLDQSEPRTFNPVDSSYKPSQFLLGGGMALLVMGFIAWLKFRPK